MNKRFIIGKSTCSDCGWYSNNRCCITATGQMVLIKHEHSLVLSAEHSGCTGWKRPEDLSPLWTEYMEVQHAKSN